VVRDRDPLVGRLRCFQDDMAADLVYFGVLPPPAQDISEMQA